MTRNVAECPGESSGVFFPAILKSWESLPLLVTVKITVPVGALRFDSVNLRSVAVTVTWVVTVEWAVACDALGLAPPPAIADATPTSNANTAQHTNRIRIVILITEPHSPACPSRT